LRAVEWERRYLRRELLQALKRLRRRWPKPRPWYARRLRQLLQLMLKWLRVVHRRRWLPRTLRPFLQIVVVGVILALTLSLSLVISSAVLLGVLKALQWYQQQQEETERIGEAGRTPEAVDEIPPRSQFVMTQPEATLPEDVFESNGQDSPEGVKFREAALALHERWAIPLPVPPERPPLDLDGTAAHVIEALDPQTTITRRARSVLAIPTETIVPVMAHPSFADPMYKPLLAVSSEFLIPNLELIPNNTMTLLETNPRFIEAYMVGLNHEMARELLWREYPTDQRGSYFRQFWDVGEYVNRAGGDRRALEEALRDIIPIHQWGRATRLGSHANRQLPGGETRRDGLVLGVKADLLKRYPTAVIFAQRARREPGGRRVLDESDPASNILSPLFTADVPPNVRFAGFDLTPARARGDRNDPGWFFVIQERPGEPRFGLDAHDRPQPLPASWDDLSWNHLGDPETVGAIDLGVFFAEDISRAMTAAPDKDIEWNVNAADMAYILYQTPVMVAIHADQMLPRDDKGPGR
jgi:hypothetical protein